jgi:hypothetical protein
LVICHPAADRVDDKFRHWHVVERVEHEGIGVLERIVVVGASRWYHPFRLLSAAEGEVRDLVEGSPRPSSQWPASPPAAPVG